MASSLLDTTDPHFETVEILLEEARGGACDACRTALELLLDGLMEQAKRKHKEGKNRDASECLADVCCRLPAGERRNDLRP